MNAQNFASRVIDPKGDPVEFGPRGEEKLLAVDPDLGEATGLYADRFQPGLYRERPGPSAAGAGKEGGREDPVAP